MKRFALIIGVIMFVTITFTGAAPAYTVTLDAATRDVNMNPITPATLVVIDNSQGEEALTGVRFLMNTYGGSVEPNGLYSWSDQSNPFYGLGFADIQQANGHSYMQGVSFHAEEATDPYAVEWGPLFVQLAASPDEDEMLLVDVVPAGCVLAVVVRFREDTLLFPPVIPAAGEELAAARGIAKADGVETTVIDWDPRPQSMIAPEPATMLTLAAACPALAMAIRRRVGS